MVELYLSFALSAREILSRVLLRKGIPFEIVPGENGKPRLAGGEVEFNLTHTETLAMCALSPAGEPVGIDAELLGKTRPAIVRRAFGAMERAFCRTDYDFYDLWTKKESVIKYHGGSLLRDLAGTIVIPPENALYRGSLSPARLETNSIEHDGRTYVYTLAHRDPHRSRLTDFR